MKKTFTVDNNFVYATDTGLIYKSHRELGIEEVVLVKEKLHSLKRKVFLKVGLCFLAPLISLTLYLIADNLDTAFHRDLVDYLMLASIIIFVLFLFLLIPYSSLVLNDYRKFGKEFKKDILYNTVMSFYYGFEEEDENTEILILPFSRFQLDDSEVPTIGSLDSTSQDKLTFLKSLPVVTGQKYTKRLSGVFDGTIQEDGDLYEDTYERPLTEAEIKEIKGIRRTLLKPSLSELYFYAVTIGLIIAIINAGGLSPFSGRQLMSMVAHAFFSIFAFWQTYEDLSLYFKLGKDLKDSKVEAIYFIDESMPDYDINESGIIEFLPHSGTLWRNRLIPGDVRFKPIKSKEFLR